jgi:MOSC domain-containing protein YiiM
MAGWLAGSVMDRMDHPPTVAAVESVNVGEVRTVMLGERRVRTAIWKAPIEGPVRLHGVKLEGDAQADRAVHGGPDKAVYAYAAEDLAWWTDRLDRPVAPGTFGENLTTRGIDLDEALVGERWTVGSTVLEVTQPRVPCYKLGIRMGDPRFPAAFAAAGRSGAYLRIIAEGILQAGDPIHVLSKPDHGVTIGLVRSAYHSDHRLAARLLDAPELPEPLVRWATRVIEAQSA